MTEDFKAMNGFLILTNENPGDGTIELPDSARGIGSPSGRVLHLPTDVEFTNKDDIVFYDAAKAYRIKTVGGEYIAVKEEDVICKYTHTPEENTSEG
jgi:hypothetical protein